MATILTAEDLADYTVTMASSEGTITRTIRAAYDTTEPGWVVFKDHEHRTVARVSEHMVLMVERAADGHDSDSDEDRIRAAMAEAYQDPGHVITR